MSRSPEEPNGSIEVTFAFDVQSTMAYAPRFTSVRAKEKRTGVMQRRLGQMRRSLRTNKRK